MIRLLGNTSVGSRRAALDNSWKSLSSLRVFSSTNASLSPKGTPYSELTVGIPKENFPLEKRVAATPESVKRLVKPGFSVLVEDGAGDTAYFSNADYEAAGAKIVPSVWKDSDIILKLRPPTAEQVDQLDGSKTLFSFLYPRQNEELLQQLQDKGTTAFAMDMIPRTLSRGQTYDALSVSRKKIIITRTGICFVQQIPTFHSFNAFFLWHNLLLVIVESSQYFWIPCRLGGLQRLWSFFCGTNDGRR